MASVLMLAPYVILGEQRAAALMVGVCAFVMAGANSRRVGVICGIYNQNGVEINQPVGWFLISAGFTSVLLKAFEPILGMRLMRAVLAALGCAIFLFSSRSGGNAELGRQATNRDNRTPINGFAIGFPMPGGGQIVDQRVLLADGWKTFGWALHGSKDDAWWFAPLSSYITTQPVSIMPPSFKLQRLDKAGVIVGYNAFLAYLEPADKAATRAPDRLLIAPCFANSWPGPYLIKPIKLDP